jgi:tRNA(fMet)-specific endonuclease VapC
MLDTNTASYIIKLQSVAARQRFHEVVTRDPDGVCISVITEAEFRYGLAKRPEAHRLRYQIDRFLAKITVLPWGSDEAIAYAGLRAKMESRGLSLGAHDMLIAAHSVAASSILVASDRAFFQSQGLFNAENWATDLKPKTH